VKFKAVKNEEAQELIVTHKNSDFDAIASIYAANILYPDAIPVLPKTVNLNVRSFLSIHKDHFPSYLMRDVDFNHISRLIVVDTGTWSRIEGFEILKEMGGLKIHLWDHHDEKGDISADFECREHVGATVSLLVRTLKEKQRKISPIEATLFLTGIYEDTGNLIFPSTNSNDAKAVAFLLDNKADLNIARTFLRQAYGPKQKDVLFEMLKNAERTRLNGYTVSISKLEIEGHTPGLALVVDMYQDILNVDGAFGIFTDQKRDRTIVIGRSEGDTLNVGSVMKGLGGGGHFNAGSAQLKFANPETVEELITELISGNQPSSVQVGDLMSFPVFTVSLESSLKDVAFLMREKGCTGIPVTAEGVVQGVISRTDIRKMRDPDKMNAPVKAHMSSNLVTIAPESGVSQAATLMVKHNIGRLPVVEEGKLIGIVTRSDIMRYYYDLLPV
jgi:nanoRNase/pAp phosphatase (c-di-AMP/oligoRNAs hydrolase)